MTIVAQSVTTLWVVPGMTSATGVATGVPVGAETASAVAAGPGVPAASDSGVRSFAQPARPASETTAARRPAPRRGMISSW
jgi:hypothetical protein